VLLAHEHRIARESLCAQLTQAELRVCAEAKDAAEAREQACRLRPEVAIVDLAARPIEAVSGIRAASPGTRAVLLTALSDPDQVLEALREGVKAYVLKSQTVSDLVCAVWTVADGGEYLCPSLAPSLMPPGCGTARASAGLSARQREVLRLVAEGKTTKEIAGVLGVSVKTADSHRTRLMEKLAVHETAGLVRYAIRLGLIEP
jgi:DNA-binding NarL/FixJ family response regulator